MERYYLQWNLVNWITIILMVSLGTVLFGFASSALRQFGGGSDDDN